MSSGISSWCPSLSPIRLLKKKRPAVVISSAAYHQAHPDLIVMAITSQMQAATIADNVTVTNWQGLCLEVSDVR